MFIAFENLENPLDHSDHDPSLCDYARIWLTQQFVEGKHQEHINKLSNEQIVIIGSTSALYSTYTNITDLYQHYNLTLKQLWDFSEYLRVFLLTERGFSKLMPPKNVNLN